MLFQTQIVLKKIVLISFAIFSAQVAYSQSRNYSNEFLNIGVDAAAFGMSKSVTATTSDVNAIYWNPAGLADVQIDQAALMHTEHFAGIAKYDYVAAAFAPKEPNGAAFAVALIRFGVDDILNTTALINSNGDINYDNISLFSAADYGLNVAFAKRMATLNNLQVGINAKVIRRVIGDFASSWGFGIDAGIQYQSGPWKWGLMLRDITTTFNSWTFDAESLKAIQNAIPNQNQEAPESNEITLPKAQIGVARSFEFKNKKFQLLSAIDLHVRFTETNDVFSSSKISGTPSIGFQLDYDKIVFLRGGVGNFQNLDTFNDGDSSLSFDPNLGIGFRYHGVQVDYALSNIASSGNALYSNTFSIKVDFNFLNK